MRRSLWLLAAGLLSVATLGCPTDDDVAQVNNRVSALRDSVKIWADSVAMYLDGVHGAVCKLATTPPVTTLPDLQRFKCVGTPETTPPPKYPPR